MSLTDGLVGLWSPFAGASGYRLLDRSGRGNHGTLTNMSAGTDWVGATVRGKSGFALDFDGTNDYVTIANKVVHSPTRITLALWYNTRTLPNSDFPYRFCLVSNADSSPPYGAWEIRGASSTTLEGIVAISGESRTIALGTMVQNVWTFVTVTYDGTSLKGFRNGIEQETKSYSGTAGTTPQPIMLGENPGTPNRPYNGLLSDFSIYNRAISPAEIYELYRRGPGWYQRFPRRVNANVTKAYTLTAAAGSFTLTGNDATLKVARKLSSDTVAFALTGNDSNFKASRKLAADTESFTLIGNDAEFTLSRKLVSETGAFALTGNDATLTSVRKLTTESVAFTLSGIDLAIQVARKLDPVEESFTLSGNDAALTAARKLAADTESYVLTGNDATLDYDQITGDTYTLSCDAESFTLTGQDAGLKAGRKIAAEPVAFTLTGQDNALKAARKLAATTQSLTLTGQDASIKANRKLTTAPESFTLSGVSAVLRAARRIPGTTGNYVLTGKAANLTYSGTTGTGSAAYYYYHFFTGA